MVGVNDCYFTKKGNKTMETIKTILLKTFKKDIHAWEAIRM
jgi:hypothetical protein